jgi:dienelactone hydrolase
MRVDSPAPGAPGIVIVGALPNGETLDAVAERYTAHGFSVVMAGVQAAVAADAGAASVRAALDLLRASCERVAVAGYGFGGAAAFLAVTQLGADAGVAFCGSGIGALLGDARSVRAPLSLHFADDDVHVPFAEVRAIKGALEGFGTVEIYRYATYDDAAATMAEWRAFAVLDTLRAVSG